MWSLRSRRNSPDILDSLSLERVLVDHAVFHDQVDCFDVSGLPVGRSRGGGGETVRTDRLLDELS